jgi:hypothetical protein
MGNLPNEPAKVANYGRVNPNAKGVGLRESLVDRKLTVYTWALNESVGRPRGGMQLTEAGVARIFSLVEDLNTGTGTPNPKKPPPPPPEDTQQPAWTGRKSAPATDAAPAEPASTPATPTPGAGVFSQMTNQLANTGTSSTGGQTQGTATGLTHTANPTNPNQPPASTAPAANPAPASDAAPTTAPPATNTAPATDPAPAATTAAPADPAKKGMLGRAADWAKTKGHNLTTKVTADKLQSAWKKAGSPMDSDKVAQVLQGAGVDPQVINQAYTGLKIPAPAAVSADATQANAPAADPAQANAPADATTNADPAQAQQDQQPANNKKPGFLSRLGKGLQGAMKGIQTSQDLAAAKKAGGYNLELETNAANKFLAQRGAVTDMRDPATFQKELQDWAKKRYPGLDVSGINVTNVKPGSKSGVQDYVTQVYSTYMADRSNRSQNSEPSSTPASTTPQSTTVDPAQEPATDAAATAEPEKKKSGRVGKGAALKQVDQTVDAIKKVRTRDRPGVIQTAQTKIGALAGENPAQSAPAATTAAPAPEEEENPNIVRGYNEGLQFSESFDPGALLWKKLNR